MKNIADREKYSAGLKDLQDSMYFSGLPHRIGYIAAVCAVQSLLHRIVGDLSKNSVKNSLSDDPMGPVAVSPDLHDYLECNIWG